MKYSPDMNLFIVSAVLVSALIVFAWKQRERYLGRYFIVMLFLVLIWIVGYIFELALTNMGAMILTNRIQISAASLLPVIWLFLVYSHFYKSRFFGPFKYLMIIPGATNILLWFVPRPNILWGHPQLIYEQRLILMDYGYNFWFYYIHNIYSYSLIVLAVCVLIVNMLKAHNLYKKQILLILFSIMLPSLVGIGYAFGISPNEHINYTSAMFSISSFMLFWAFFKYKYLEIIPRARNNIIESIDEGVIVVDDMRKIIDINPAAMRITGLSRNDIGASMDDREEEIVKRTRKMTVEGIDRDAINIFDMKENIQKTFDIKMSVLKGPDAKKDGAVFILIDQTEKKRLYDKIYEQSIKDELTGIYNRRHLFEKGGAEIDSLKSESRKSLSLMVLDIDGMKEINDKYGHYAGDAVIKAFSERIDKIIRSTDMFGRIGGDEFVMVLPDTDPERAKAIASRIIENVNAKKVKTSDGNEVEVKASIGLVNSEDFSVENIELDEMYRIADKMMYKAKKEGGNKAVCYDG